MFSVFVYLGEEGLLGGGGWEWKNGNKNLEGEIDLRFW